MGTDSRKEEAKVCLDINRPSQGRTYRDLKKAPSHLTRMRSSEAERSAHLNHAVSEGSTNREISVPGVDGRLSVKQIPSPSVRPHAVC
jgi:hypothetical protein